MTDEVPLAIGGLPLPPALISALREGRWVAPSEAVLAGVFPERPIDALFYGPSGMIGTNQTWQSERREEYICDPDPGNPPGDIEPARSVLIGDLGPDQMFALDYRRSPDRPSVVYLAEPGWVEVAPDFETLAARLRLTSPS